MQVILAGVEASCYNVHYTFQAKTDILNKPKSLINSLTDNLGHCSLISRRWTHFFLWSFPPAIPTGVWSFSKGQGEWRGTPHLQNMCWPLVLMSVYAKQMLYFNFPMGSTKCCLIKQGNLSTTEFRLNFQPLAGGNSWNELARKATYHQRLNTNILTELACWDDQASLTHSLACPFIYTSC